MKFLNLLLALCFVCAVSFLSSVSFAAPTAIQCPATNDTVKAFRNKLLELKSAIKSDANCTPIKADVDKLGNLLTKDRPKFLDLIAQGQVEGLSEVEEGQVQTYVNDLTVTTYNLLAVVTGNDACFEEDKQGSSLQFLSSVIGEGSKLLAIAGGPTLGPIIGLAGEAVTGFMGAMQTIAENRIGYDFNNNDQQIAYADSLCTLFEAKRELTVMVSSAESISRLVMLQAAIEKQVADVVKACPECAQLKGMVDMQTSRALADGEIRNTAQVWPNDFEAQVKELAKTIDGAYTNPIGTNLFRSLKTLTWIPLRIQALEAEQFNVDIVLASVIGEMEEVEEFMLKDQGSQYLESLLRDAEESIWSVNDLVNAQTYFLARNGGGYIEPYNGFTLLAGTYNTAEEFYTKLFEGLDTLRSSTQDTTVSDDVDEFFSVLDQKSRFLNVKIDVLDKYCTFFQTSKWGWNQYGLKGFCNQEYISDIKHQAYLLTNYRILLEAADLATECGSEDGSDCGEMVAEPVVVMDTPPMEEAKDTWDEALRVTIEEQATDEYYVERRW